MKNIIDFTCSKINYILHQLEINESALKRGNVKFNIPYTNKDEKLTYSFMGSGTYGNVLRLKNYTSDESIVPYKDSIIVKIMKIKHDEPVRCKKIKKNVKRIKSQKKNKEENKKKLELIKKYTTAILDVKNCKGVDIIFLEYLDGYDLKDYVVNNNLSIMNLENIYLQCLVSVRIFHKILRLSHRDLKLENLYYNEPSQNIKVIDYSFVCDKDDRDCYERNQGTAKYIHLKQNKITTKKHLRNNNSNSSISSISNKNTRTRKRQYNFPSSFSQDLFSLIIILFKLYYENKKKKKGSLSSLYDIIDDYNNNFKKHRNKYEEKKRRYKLKNKLFQDLLSLSEEDIEYPSLQIMVNVIRKYWNFKKRDFVYHGETGDKVASQIIDELIDSITNLSGNSSPKNRELMDDIVKLKMLNN